jgi:hypothetical protein
MRTMRSISIAIRYVAAVAKPLNASCGTAACVLRISVHAVLITAHNALLEAVRVRRESHKAACLALVSDRARLYFLTRRATL